MEEGSAADRLAKRTIRNEEGCWLWQGARSTAGYARAKVDGRQVTVQHVMYGHVEPGHWLVKAPGCSHRHCVNPEHWLAIPRG